MKYLLHGVMQQSLARWPPELGIRVLAANGLAAAVSPLEDVSSPPGIPRLLAYERVVEAIHARQAVIPLRYGCAMESESAVIRLLEDHRQEYEALLTRLQGMTEIAIRVLWPARATVLPGAPSSPGAAYLASVRARHNSANTLAPEEAQLANRITDLLSGCSTEQRKEVSSSGPGLLISLYFLTSATYASEFLQKARRIRPPSAAKLLLSGPWPPYNFVAPVDGL
jgi:hypothetical protein